MGQSFIGTAPPLFARFSPETAAPLSGWRLCGARADDRKKILTSFFQCVKVALFFFRTPVHMHVLTIPQTRDRGYTDGRVKCRKPVEEPGTAPRVRVGNFVALLIERKSSSF